ncbi:MAG: DNA polymerase I [Coriobacteriia bacterium]|nr:DNA polymerase I [Coriobacteriia bacterium]
MTKTIAVIDGNSLMHRAFHAVPPSMTAPDGTPTNAAFGFLSMFLKFIEMEHPDAVVCAFDKGRPAFRTEALEQYKATRPPMDPALKAQFPIIEELLESMNIPVVALPGWEGDDILGTVSARCEKLGYESLLVTGDKDAYQLSSELTHIVTTKRGITDVVIYGPDEVFERYGVTPEQFPDFLGLMGDSSDNIPGVPGIGAKTAAKLLSRFGSMEGIYENLDKLKGKQLENLTNNRDAAFLSRQVATIVRDADFELDLESLIFPDFDPAQASEAFGKVRMMSHLGKVLSLLDDDVAVSTQAELPSWEPLLSGQDAQVALDEAIESGEPIALAWSEQGQASLFDSNLKLAVRTLEGTALFGGSEAQDAIARIVRKATFQVHDAKEAIKLAFPSDSSKNALLTPAEVMAASFFDVALASYVCNSDAGKMSLAELAETKLGVLALEGDEPDVALAKQAAIVSVLADRLAEELEQEKSSGVYHSIDAPLVGVLACMERVGAAIDVEELASISQETAAELEQLRKRIFELAGEEFNVDSPKQLSHILFDVLGLPPKKKTRSGYSTDAKVLKELSGEHELPAKILEYREYAKIKSTYVDALPRMRADDGLVHSSFHEMVTTTGRLSSSNPNLQNIPVRTDFGRRIRRCFVPLKPGHLFVSADYSQIELRLLAHLSGDETLISAFNSGADFHAATAANVFDVAVEEVTPQMRSRAKAVNFGIVYGQQAFGLSQSLGVPLWEAQEMIDRYFAAHPRVKDYLEEVVARAKVDGYAQTLFGRRRHIPDLRSSNGNKRRFGERTAMNHPMQGTAADIIKMAMVQVSELLIADGFEAQMLLQVHDELDFSCPEGELESLTDLVTQAMQGVVELKVPLLVDVSAASNWAEAH